MQRHTEFPELWGEVFWAGNSSAMHAEFQGVTGNSILIWQRGGRCSGGTCTCHLCYVRPAILYRLVVWEMELNLSLQDNICHSQYLHMSLCPHPREVKREVEAGVSLQLGLQPVCSIPS